ncbi:MAG: 50S ribosomal protein L23 [Candidatus Zixiibacteriota bacterium]
MKIDSRKLIKTHVNTERTASLRTGNNEYVFKVDPRANKHEIKQAVEQAFKVKVTEVRTMRIPGKTRRMGRYDQGFTSTYKKAVVRLKKGEVISIFENV